MGRDVREGDSLRQRRNRWQFMSQIQCLFGASESQFSVRRKAKLGKYRTRAARMKKRPSDIAWPLVVYGLRGWFRYQIRDAVRWLATSCLQRRFFICQQKWRSTVTNQR